MTRLRFHAKRRGPAPMAAKPPAKRKRTVRRLEDPIHAAIAGYLRIALPRGAMFWATINEGKRTGQEQGRIRAAGIKPGVPDLFVLHAGRLIGLEVKSAKGKASDKQTDFADELRAAGACWHIVRSIDDAYAALKNEGVPLKVRPVGL